jgi:hypothetical protein
MLDAQGHDRAIAELLLDLRQSVLESGILLDQVFARFVGRFFTGLAALRVFLSHAIVGFGDSDHVQVSFA